MKPFHGFTLLDANYVYCPNQFLDVCLPHCSRGVVRLVAYILDQTLGWLDRQGNPISQKITVSFNQLINDAGISRGAIRKAIDEAIAQRFICCLQEGSPATSGKSPEHAAYALRWDEDINYHATPETFRGFYPGDGHRTPIPNAFFRHVIPRETLTVTKVVGAVLRHTVGYQNQFGGRRSQAPLSYRFIQDYANIPDPKSLRTALLSAIESKYIVCIEEGNFHTDVNKRKPATYAIKWLANDVSNVGSSKIPADNSLTAPAKKAIQYSERDRFRNPSEGGSINPTARQFKIPIKEKTIQKDTLKQQQEEPVVVNLKEFHLLQKTGFDEATAKQLSTVADCEQIKQQIAWLAGRNVEKNRLGMLRRAIENNWSAPEQPIDVKTVNRERRQKYREQSRQLKEQERKLLASKIGRIQRRRELQTLWNELSKTKQTRIESAALENQNSQALQRLFRTSDSHRRRECLRQLDREMTATDSQPYGK